MKSRGTAEDIFAPSSEPAHAIHQPFKPLQEAAGRKIFFIGCTSPSKQQAL